MKKKFIYLASLFLFALYLLYANTIVAFFLPYNFRKMQINSEDLENKQVYFSIRPLEMLHGLFDSIVISGTVFCETETTNSNKYGYIILTSERETYYFKIEYFWGDGNLARVLFPERIVLNDNNEFKVVISSVGIKNGIYDLYIYCSENDEDYGISNTGIQLIKDRNGLNEYRFTSFQVDLHSITVSDEKLQIWQSSWIDTLSIEGDYLIIGGWCYVPDLNAGIQDVYILLYDVNGEFTSYNTLSIPRLDVGIHFDNALYYYSGFRAAIPLIAITDDLCEVSISIVNDGKLYHTDIKTAFVLDDLGYRFQSNRVDMSSITVADTPLSFWVNCWIDKLEVEGDSLIVGGWGYVPGLETSSQKIYIDISNSIEESIFFDTRLTARRDVSEHFSNNQYAFSGFRATIPLDALPYDLCEISISIINDGKLYHADTKMALVLDDLGYRFQSHRVDMSSIAVAETLLSFWENCWIDTLEVEGDSLIVGGWGYVPGLETSSQKIYVELSDSNEESIFFDTRLTIKRDVGEHFGNSLYDFSGFRATIPLASLYEGLSEITIRVLNEGELYKTDIKIDFDLDVIIANSNKMHIN